MKSKTREHRAEWIQHLEMLTLYLQAGYDLAYAWEQAVSPWACRHYSLGEASLVGSLSHLSEEASPKSLRAWFLALKRLYQCGATTKPAVVAMADHLRKEMERDLEAHLRGLPLKLSVAVMLFFLPVTLLMLFLPLLLELGRAVGEF